MYIDKSYKRVGIEQVRFGYIIAHRAQSGNLHYASRVYQTENEAQAALDAQAQKYGWKVAKEE